MTFANVTDSWGLPGESAPQLSLSGFSFAGQLVPIYMVMMIEVMRH